MAARGRPPGRRRPVPAPARRRRRGGASSPPRRDHADADSTSRSSAVSSPSPFVAELTTEPPEHLARADTQRSARATGLGTRQAGRARPPAPRPISGDGGGGPGAGRPGPRVDHHRARTRGGGGRAGGAVRRFRIGSKVETAGSQRGKLSAPPRRGQPRRARSCSICCGRSAIGPATASRRTPCSTTRRSPASPRPARRPRRPRRVKGVGPAKLEQYGDDVLAIVATAATSP